MLLVRRTIVPIRVFLALLFALLLVMQFLSMPGQFAYMAEQSPEHAHLRWPLTGLAAFWILCAQVVVVCTWKLLTLVGENRIFSRDSFGWVDGIVASFAGAWVVLVGVAVSIGSRADDPSTPLLLLLLWTVLTVGALLMVVMRSLLRQATALRADLDEVI